MIEQSSFKKLRVFKDFFLGRSAAVSIQHGNGQTTKMLEQQLTNFAQEGRYQSVAADTTLTKYDGGKTFLLINGGYTITLPSAVYHLGTRFKFVVAVPQTAGDVDIVVAGGNRFQGPIMCSAAAAVVTADSANIVTFVDDFGKVGDWLEVTSTGFQWLITGGCRLAAGMKTTT